MSSDASDTSSLWQRLAITVAAGLITAAVIGIYALLGQLNDKIDASRAAQSVTQTQVAIAQSQISDVRTAIQGVYTQHDAKRDLDAVFRTDKDQYARLDDLEKRMRAVEARKR